MNGSLDDGTVNDSTPGDSFGTGGRVTTDFVGKRDVINSLAIQSDGMIVAAGAADSGSNPVARDFGLARYNIDGTLDSTFGTGGKVTTNIVTGVQAPGLTFSDDVATTVKIQADGRIVVLGYSDLRVALSDDQDLAMARYTTTGALDPTFTPDGSRPSVAGTRRVNFSVADFGKDVLVQPDGKYLIVGDSNSAASGTPNYSLVFARLNNGSGREFRHDVWDGRPGTTEHGHRVQE